MSRIGRHPVAIPAGVTVEIAEKNVVTVKGPKGTLVRDFQLKWKSKRRRRSYRNKTERSQEDEISSWSYKNTDQQHGNRCY